jgi:lipid II isoglutaminyl synthase (glutamine-hydrolysing)
VRRVVCTGTRAPEMALRLKYAGWPAESIEVVPEIEASLDRAVAAAPGRLFALPTYTALLELRKLLADRGLAKEFWQ